MGLNCSHGAFDGAYSSFQTWRNMIAMAAGWTFRSKPGQDERTTAEAIAAGDWGRIDYVIPSDRAPHTAVPDPYKSGYSTGVYLGVWEDDPADVLDVLLVHSDCEGSVPNRFCRDLADRLSELAEKLVALPNIAWILEWAEDTTYQFITGLLKADLSDEDLEFR